MRKIILSTITVLAIGSTLSADGVMVKSKAGVLKFNGVHYLGFTKFSDDINSSKDFSRFEGRRNYLQVKAYFLENPKSYFRVTIDSTKSDGDITTRFKYAYLYLDNVLPFTGVEIGQVHRPWIDYEEHSSWLYRSISKVYVEAHEGAHLTNSADRGINFKTKTENFSSELGVFNGEGYHDSQVGTGLSKEWRLTYHALATGKTKHAKKYFNLSYFGQINDEYKGRKNTAGELVDLKFSGVHAVYNQPEFLLAAQYVKVSDGDYDKAGVYKKVEGKGYSVNGEYRFNSKYAAIGRYDKFEFDKDSSKKERKLAALSYKYNKNVKFLLNMVDEQGKKSDGTKTMDQKYTMLTAEVKW